MIVVVHDKVADGEREQLGGKRTVSVPTITASTLSFNSTSHCTYCMLLFFQRFQAAVLPFLDVTKRLHKCITQVDHCCKCTF